MKTKSGSQRASLARNLLFLALAALPALIVMKVSDFLDPTTNPPAAIPDVWAVSALTRVGPSDPPAPLLAIALYGARGEIVDAQIVVRARTKDLSNVNVSASALQGPQ